jgi:uncharacterized protein (UPF0276 family)
VQLKHLVRRYEPEFVSDHLSWGSIGGRYLSDLLPLPYTEEALAHVVTRVRAAQEFLGRELLNENPSTYLQRALDQPGFEGDAWRRARNGSWCCAAAFRWSSRT